MPQVVPSPVSVLFFPSFSRGTVEGVGRHDTGSTNTCGSWWDSYPSVPGSQIIMRPPSGTRDRTVFHSPVFTFSLPPWLRGPEPGRGLLQLGWVGGGVLRGIQECHLPQRLLSLQSKELGYRFVVLNQNCFYYIFFFFCISTFIRENCKHSQK